MKICLVTSMHSWNDDRIFERTAVGLADIGHKVFLIAPSDSSKKVEGVQIIPIPIRKRLFKHILGPFDAFNELNKIEADVFHFFNPNMMWLMKTWAKKGHYVYIDIHENYEARIDNLLLPKFLRNIFVKGYRRLENFFCASYKGVTVVTQSMADKLKPSGTPILVVDNVPYLKSLKSIKLAEKKNNRPTIITSGTHSSARNCINAVKALPEIVAEIPNVMMKFVGRFEPKEYENELIAKAKELGVLDNFETEGMLPWLDNFIRVSKAQVGCVFYNDNLNNRVTLPNRLYEYMYCGLSVLGENFPEVANVIDKNQCGALVNSQDPSNIAHNAIKILTSPAKLQIQIENAKAAIYKKHNFENALKELDRFYRR